MTRLLDPTVPLSIMEQVTLGALNEMEHEGTNTAHEIAEAVAAAQEYLPPWERHKTPITGPVLGQYLGLLRQRGLVWCDPEPLVQALRQVGVEAWEIHAPITNRRRRCWFLTDAGRREA